MSFLSHSIQQRSEFKASIEIAAKAHTLNEWILYIDAIFSIYMDIRSRYRNGGAFSGDEHLFYCRADELIKEVLRLKQLEKKDYGDGVDEYGKYKLNLYLKTFGLDKQMLKFKQE